VGELTFEHHLVYTSCEMRLREHAPLESECALGRQDPPAEQGALSFHPLVEAAPVLRQ